MDISIEKLNLIQQILLISDDRFIKSINKFMESHRIPGSSELRGWEDLPAYQKESIEKSQLQMEAGLGIPMDEVIAKYRQRYSS